MFKKILCPVDLSDFTKFQLEFARGLSREQNSKITAVNVLRLPIDIYEMASWDSLYKQLEKRAQESMKMYCNSDITPLFSEGLNEAQKIVQIAVEGQYDLILMPTHGYRGLQKVFLGSVFQEVLMKSHLPVLALPPKFIAKGPGEFKKPINILCAIDLHVGSGKLIDFTEMLGHEFEATFSIVHSIDLKTELLGLLHEDPFVEEKTAVKKKVLLNYPLANKARQVFISHGAPHETILSAIEDHVDLVVLGYSLSSQRRLRSTLYRVIAELNIPAFCVEID